jgi:hypothetical protein
MVSRRTKSIGTKVTPDEYDRIHALAGEQPISEWVRAALLKAAADPPMSYEWGRAPEAGKWQRAAPVWFMSVILLALASGIGVWWVRQTFVWTPLQQFYLSAYARSALASLLAIRTGQ